MIAKFAALMLPTHAQVESLGQTLMHFLWQGALIAALAAAALWILRDSTPQRRYAAACLALLAMAAAPLLTFLWISAAPDLSTMPMQSNTATDWPDPMPPMAIQPVQTSLPADWMPYLVAAWFAGAALLTLRLLAGWALTLKLRNEPNPAPLNWLCHIERLRILLGVGRKVRLAFTARVDTPAVVGWLRPIVLMPLHMAGLAPEQAELLLAHEIAHIRRHDAFVNFFQRLVEAVLFYHPAVWWLTSRVRVEREHCCDDIAVSLCGDPLLYARTLVALEESRAALPALALAANDGDLASRVRRILGLREETSDPWTPIAVTILTLGVLFVNSTAYQSTFVAPKQTQWDNVTTSRAWTASRLSTLLAYDEVARSQPTRYDRRGSSFLRPVMMRVAHALDADDQDFIPPAPPEPPMTPAPATAQAPPAPPPPPAPAATAAPPVPPVPPARAAAPVPPVPPAPPLHESHNSWAWSWSNNGDSGRISINDETIRFIEDGKHYVIRDPATVAQARSMFDEVRAKGQKQREIGRAMRQRSMEQAHEARQLSMHYRTDLQREIERIQSQIRAAATRQDTARIQALAKELSEKAQEFGNKAGAEATAKVEDQLKDLNVEMKRLNEEMRSENAEAMRRLRETLREAVRTGKAQLDTL